MRLSFHSTWLVDLLKKMHQNRKLTFIDVGVNLGQTLLGLKSIDHEGLRYIGIEPNPVCVNYLGKLISCNNFNDSIILPTALSSRNGAIGFIVSSDSDEAASIVAELRPDKFQKKKQYVPILKFDDIDFLRDAPETIIKIFTGLIKAIMSQK
jgi:FkbM family methyltransferase